MFHLWRLSWKRKAGLTPRKKVTNSSSQRAAAGRPSSCCPAGRRLRLLERRSRRNSPRAHCSGRSPGLPDLQRGAQAVNLFASAGGTRTDLCVLSFEGQRLPRRLLPKNNPVLRLPPNVPKPHNENQPFRRWCVLCSQTTYLNNYSSLKRKTIQPIVWSVNNKLFSSRSL